MINFVHNWCIGTWEMISESAPWLLFGFLVAGAFHTFLPNGFIENRLKKRGFKSVVKATLFGIPLPLCSCSVIPVAVSLRRGGASKGATASFLVSTPEIGADSFILSYVLLGPFLAIIRIIAVIFSSLGVGWMIDRWVDSDNTESKSMDSITACCKPSEKTEMTGASNAKNGRLYRQLKKVFRFSFVEIFDDLSIVLTVGFLGAGFISAIFPSNFFMEMGTNSFVSMVFLLFVSLPFYVCATSSTPLIAALLAKGLSPGAGLVFLLAGPATNLSTMLAVRQELGGKSLVIYLSIVSLIALLFAFLTDLFFTTYVSISTTNLEQNLTAHSHAGSSLGILLLAFLVLSWTRRIFKP